MPVEEVDDGIHRLVGLLHIVPVSAAFEHTQFATGDHGCHITGTHAQVACGDRRATNHAAEMNASSNITNQRIGDGDANRPTCCKASTTTDGALSATRNGKVFLSIISIAGRAAGRGQHRCSAEKIVGRVHIGSGSP